MLWPALRALSHGELTPDQLRELEDTLRLVPEPRTEGPGAPQSIAHRAFTDSTGASLVLDLARTGDTGWVFTLFHTGQQPAASTLEEHRALFREAIGRLGLSLVQIEPAAAADEVLLVGGAAADEAESAVAAHWHLPHADLDRVWPHLGLREDAPREVKEVKLRELMGTPAWADAPASLHEQAAEFLRSR